MNQKTDGRVLDYRVKYLSDGDELVEKVRSVFKEYGKEIRMKLTIQKRLPGKYSPKMGGEMIVITDKKETEIWGIVCMKKFSIESCELKRLYVRPMYRKRGFGKLLVKLIILSARGKKVYKRMLLDTLEYLKPAIALYKKFGFFEIEQYDNSYEPLPETIFFQLNL